MATEGRSGTCRAGESDEKWLIRAAARRLQRSSTLTLLMSRASLSFKSAAFFELGSAMKTV
jgi:hypothetical protein